VRFAQIAFDLHLKGLISARFFFCNYEMNGYGTIWKVLLKYKGFKKPLEMVMELWILMFLLLYQARKHKTEPCLLRENLWNNIGAHACLVWHQQWNKKIDTARSSIRQPIHDCSSI
jgi:hypothetical protein